MRTTTKIFGPEDFHRASRLIGVDAMMDELIERMQSAFERYDAVDTEIPVRDGFSYDEPHTGLVEWMPVMARGSHALMKLVSYHPGNPARNGLPTILSTFSLIDTSTGHMEAIADGTFLTALRTGAASALATRALAHPDSSTLGIIGCGAQAVTQLHAISRVHEFDLVLFWDTDPAARATFPSRVDGLLAAHTRLRESPIEMLTANVHILCTATSIDVGAGPLFSDGATFDALHVNAVGSDFPGKVELPWSLLEKSAVIPDFTAQALAEGECQQMDAARVGPELHEVLRADATAELRAVRTVFDSTGWALEDLVAMELLVKWSGEIGLGRDIEFESVPLDPKNPYKLAGSGKGAARHSG